MSITFKQDGAKVGDGNVLNFQTSNTAKMAVTDIGDQINVTVEPDASIHVPFAGPQALTGAGAVTVTEYFTYVTTTGADALTLADGTKDNQLKKIMMVGDGGDGTLTPANLAGFTTITFADAGDTVEMLWSDANGAWGVGAVYNTVNPALGGPALA